METTSAENILQRLKTALSAKSDSELGRLLGISQQAISNARNNNKLPDAWVRIAAERFELCADWLFFGRGPSRPAAADQAETQAGPGKKSAKIIRGNAELTMIPLVEARLSAGAGSLETGGESEKSYAFRSDFLHRKGHPADMILMRVAGDSMEPEIKDNDVVLLDQSKRDILPGKIFAVGFEDAIYLKRIDTLPGKIVLKSANPVYPPVELDVRGDCAEQFRVIGRVLWSGREYK